MADNEEKPSPALIDLLKRQSEQIDVLILQNKRLDERMLAVEAQLHILTNGTASSARRFETACDGVTDAVTEQQSALEAKAPRSKKKGAQSLSAIWFEWFTAEPRVYASRSVKKTALYEYRHITGYLMLFLPLGFKLDTSSPAYKSEVLELGDTVQQNTLAFLKAHGSSAVAAGTALKALRQMQKLGKLDSHIAQFHERDERGDVVDPTPPAARRS
ncbi:hypothetical protein ON010_g7714 [Phytophthora cinnamomi]|nr:hypothetical protein ON010_g7714 [Phytophthora cinnamomi]